MHVLIVGPRSSGFLYFAAGKKLGLQISAITTDSGSWAMSDDVRNQAYHVAVVQYDNMDSFVGAACRLHKIEPIDGVLAGSEMTVEHAAAVADVLGLAFISPADVGSVRNKAEMRRRLHEAGVRAPRFATAGNAVDVEQIADVVGFPAVIKPLKMAGSAGVARVNNTTELLAAYEDIIHDEGGWGTALGTEVLVEEFLEGTEYIVDGCVNANGDIDIFEFCEYEFGPQPHFQVLGYTVYHEEDLPESAAMKAYVAEVVRALRIPAGPLHAEVILTKEGPVLVEIANRLPGAHVPETASLVTGRSLVEYALMAAIGQLAPRTVKPTARVAGCRYITSPTALLGKTYGELVGWDEIATHPLVDAASIDIEPGAPIPPHIDERSWIAGVRYHASSLAEAEAFRNELLERVHVTD